MGLGWDNLWLEGYQYLAIIERDADRKAAFGSLSTPLLALRRRESRRAPVGATLLEGNLERDLAKLLLRAGRGGEVAAHLQRAQGQVERAGDAGMLAATHMEWALLAGTLAALCFIDAVRPQVAHGMPIDGAQIGRAAEHRATNGHGLQARQLLALAPVRAALPDDLRGRLERLAGGGATP